MPDPFRTARLTAHLQHPTDQHHSDSSHLGADSSHLGAVSSHLGADSSHLGADSSHLGADPSHLGAVSPFLGRTRAVRLPPEYPEVTSLLWSLSSAHIFLIGRAGTARAIAVRAEGTLVAVNAVEVGASEWPGDVHRA